MFPAMKPIIIIDTLETANDILLSWIEGIKLKKREELPTEMTTPIIIMN